MSTAATVLIPTFDHGPMLSYSIKSALRQTVAEIEIFLVGDGISDAGRDVALAACAADRRVRFFDNPKGERHGEAHRDAALAEATGEIVCYLSDDDLWFDDHIERMHHLLSSADLAHTLGSYVDTKGHMHALVFDVTRQGSTEALRRVESNAPLSAWGHRLDAYRRLTRRWSPGGSDLPTDINMWLKFLEEPWMRVQSSAVLTSVHLASADPVRDSWTIERRLEELDSWDSRLEDRSQAESLRQAINDELMALGADRAMELARVKEAHARQIESTTSLEDDLLRTRSELTEAQKQLDEIAQSRLRSRAVRLVERVPRIGPTVAAWLRRVKARLVAGP
jgi:glycosyltransferase involved in cell wall biosynthesis